MRGRVWVAAGLLAAWTGGARAQEAPPPMLRVAVTPFVTYGFYGALPDDGPELMGDVGLGIRASYRVAPRLAIFGTFQRTTPELEGAGNVRVDHWSAGAEYTVYLNGEGDDVPPLLVEAGIGQARYDFDGLMGDDAFADLALNVGVASVVRITDQFLVRYGANDYLSEFGDRGDIVNHFFAHAGVELRF